jgi:hypothetical protein
MTLVVAVAAPRDLVVLVQTALMAVLLTGEMAEEGELVPAELQGPVAPMTATEPREAQVQSGLLVDPAAAAEVAAPALEKAAPVAFMAEAAQVVAMARRTHKRLARREPAASIIFLN